jgi:phosphopentomutase
VRALLLVLDSVGCGAAPDSGEFGDEGADTLGHLRQHIPSLSIPNLNALGLGHLLDNSPLRHGMCCGTMRPRSAGKDSTTGHWEIAGVIRTERLGHFDRFPPQLVDAIEQATGVHFIGNVAASGTAILDDLGPEHLRTGSPILYTSADSVLQIAAHEQVIPVSRLYDICRVARVHADAYRIGRVIARPFLGSPGAFIRTPRRQDFSLYPPRTVLDVLQESGIPTVGVGKIGDLFAGRGLDAIIHTDDNADGMRAIERIWHARRDGLVFANLVDFDTQFGHRRDCTGYARALEQFDEWLGDFLHLLRESDLLIITADHGNDPTFRGSDHTRECVPLLVRHSDLSGALGIRESFADVAASLAHHFGVSQHWSVGKSFLSPTPTPNVTAGSSMLAYLS